MAKEKQNNMNWYNNYVFSDPVDGREPKSPLEVATSKDSPNMWAPTGMEQQNYR